MNDLCKHGDESVCQLCMPLPWGLISSLNRQTKRFARYRSGHAPLRRRRKRLHKKLAKRGFSPTPTFTIWSSPRPGYGTKGTQYDLLSRRP